jgi:histidinol dehydrogenase
MAGSNHVLPTGGTARFASGLGVHAYLKSVQVIEYSRDALADLADRIVAVAEDEDLPAHGEAVRGRF